MARLLNLVEEFGGDWAGVADKMEGRTADECRQQYESTRKDEDSEEGEDEGEEHEKTLVTRQYRTRIQYH